jgi:thioredoxin 1
LPYINQNDTAKTANGEKVMDENPASDNSNSITTDFDLFKREVIDDKKLTLVAFLADWSGPCQILDHVLEKLDDGIRGRIKIMKLNASTNKNLAERLNINSFPTLIFYKKGEIKEIMTGLISNKTISDRLDALLKESELQK